MDRGTAARNVPSLNAHDPEGCAGDDDLDECEHGFAPDRTQIGDREGTSSELGTVDSSDAATKFSGTTSLAIRAPSRASDKIPTVCLDPAALDSSLLIGRNAPGKKKWERSSRKAFSPRLVAGFWRGGSQRFLPRGDPGAPMFGRAWVLIIPLWPIAPEEPRLIRRRAEPIDHSSTVTYKSPLSVYCTE